MNAADGRQEHMGDGWEVDSTEISDLAGAFFIWAHSMRDWLIASNAAPQKKIDELLNQHQEWKLVRDLANKIKHKEINRKPVDPNWMSGMKIDANKILRGEHGIEPYILHNGNYLPYEDTIEGVSAMWDAVVTELGLECDIAALKSEAPNAPTD